MNGIWRGVRAAIVILTLYAVAGPSLLFAQTVERHALVIGNSANEIGDLKNPAADAGLIGSTLRNLDFDVTLDTDTTRSRLIDQVNQFADKISGKAAGSVSLMFFAGHGVQYEGVNYLIPADAKLDRPRDLELEAVSADWLLARIEEATDGPFILILDACRNSPFRGAERAVTRGLSSIDAPSGIFIAYSTSPGKVAYDGDGAHSPFAFALARNLTRPDTPVEIMFREVRRDVVSRTASRQVPWSASSLLGDVFMTPGSTMAASEPSQPAPDVNRSDFEIAFWESIRTSNDPRDFEIYLAEYPGGGFAGLAENRLLELRDGGEAARSIFNEVPRRFRAWNTNPAELVKAYPFEQRREDVWSPAGTNLYAGPDRRFAHIGFLRRGEKAVKTGHLEARLAASVSQIPEGSTWARLFVPRTGIVAYATMDQLSRSSIDPSADDFFLIDSRSDAATSRDCDICPEMIAIPSGRYLMGLPDDSPFHGKHSEARKSTPPTWQNIKGGLSMSVSEISYAAYDECVIELACQPVPREAGTDPKSPVIFNIFQKQRPYATDYLAWLSQKTGRAYRLPSEAEWEFAARAGTSTSYWWGDDWRGLPACEPFGGVCLDTGTNPWGLRGVLNSVAELTFICGYPNYADEVERSYAFSNRYHLLDEQPGLCDYYNVRGGSGVMNDWDPTGSAMRAFNTFLFGLRVVREAD